MEEERKKHPPVPSNFVTLVQLQERWLEEQQRKQREKGEEEERNRRVKEEEEVRKREDQQNKMRQKETGERSKTNTLSRRRPFFRKNRRNQPEKSSLTIGMIELKSEESQVGAIVVDDGERKIDDLNKKKKKNKKKGKWKKKKGKPRAEEDLIVGTEQSLPEYEEAEEKIPVVLTERDGEKEGVTTEFKRNGKNLVVNDMAWEKKVPMARSAEIGQKFENLSLSGGKGGNERYPRNMHGGQWKYNRGGSGSFNHGRLQKPRDSNLVWVRKGDTSDVSVAGVWNSGGLAKAGEGQKKPVQMRPKESSWR